MKEQDTKESKMRKELQGTNDGVVCTIEKQDKETSD